MEAWVTVQVTVIVFNSNGFLAQAFCPNFFTEVAQ
jgi:hypothetical protein